MEVTPPFLSAGTSDKVDAVFRECWRWASVASNASEDNEGNDAKPLEDVSFELWKIYLEHKIANQANDMSSISSHWAAAIETCTPAVISRLQSSYLKWICDARGIASARVHYKR